MRIKRTKTYKKRMAKFSITFGFREPYQVIVDAQIVQDAHKFAMDLIPALERTLSGKVKPLITQCSMRHLYANEEDPNGKAIIASAKLIERRFCGHRPDEHPEPLSTIDCITSIVDPKGTGHNKHRYVVATQDPELRHKLRQIPGVPLIFISRSVMIMERITEATELAREKDERDKLKAEIKSKKAIKKRKRGDDDEQDGDRDGNVEEKEIAAKKRKKAYGKKEPNPLSVKKPNKRKPVTQHATAEAGEKATAREASAGNSVPADDPKAHVKKLKKRRGSKRKPHKDGGAQVETDNQHDNDNVGHVGHDNAS